MKFWFLWGFDALVSAVVLFFFLTGLADGSVSSFNAVLWLGIVSALVVIMGGSLGLRATGHPVLAFSVLLILAVPALLGLALFAIVMITPGRWN